MNKKNKQKKIIRNLIGFKSAPLIEKMEKVMKIFYLSGISGTGRGAQGFVFDNGKVAVTWLSEHPSVTIYDNIGEIHAIHGHGGKTQVEFEPDYKRACGELKAFVENFSLSVIATEKLSPESPASKILSKNKKEK